MDSGNSGSLQSSSGGDEEYDSRAAGVDSVSAFMSGGGGPISNPPPPFFDPLSNYLQLHQNPNSSLLDPNPAWPRPAPMRSDPNHAPHNTVNPNLFPSSAAFMPSFQQAPPGADATPPPPNRNQAARNPKKRSRASRRAPTTVLTTDTTNFRAMVQEFTGIPSPPFNSSSSPFPRSRLDLFGSRSAAAFDPPAPPYLRRPFAQKPQPLPFLPPTSSAIGASSSTTNNSNSNLTSVISSSNAIAASSSSNPLFTQTNPSHLFQNQLLNSFLQTTPKFPFSNDNHNNNHNNNPHVTKMVNLDEQFNFIHSDQVADLNNNNNAGKDHKQDDDEDDEDRANLRIMTSLNGEYNFTGSKMSSSNLAAANYQHGGGGKRADQNVGGEGMVESWICSSE